MTMIAPLATSWSAVFRPLRMNRLVITVKISRPRIDPMIVPRPPLSSVPPMITAAIASSSYRSPCVDDPVVVRAMISTAAIPQHRPDSAYNISVCLRTSIPASRAASGLPPTA